MVNSLTIALVLSGNAAVDRHEFEVKTFCLVTACGNRISAMSLEKMQYDSAMGGNVVLPDHIRTFRFAAERLEEIKKLVEVVKNPQKNKLVFQSLPVRMRRRAMSHNPKRLPLKYRKKHISQMEKTAGSKVSKRPSRKFRRKPSNLLREYLRRQRRNVWLETHIWHAKKFHMIEKWGYKLPYSSCDKTFRVCYRATSRHCLIQDVSYLRCIELVGSQDAIIEGFNQLTSSKVGLGIGAKTYITGKREGSITFFKNGKYPRGALGTVTFIWKPQFNLLETLRTLWIHVHPSCYNEILMEIISCFQLVVAEQDSLPEDVEMVETEKKSKSKKKEVTAEQFATKDFKYKRVNRYCNESTRIRLTELKDTMNRFRLTGPLSQAVLSKALKCKSLNEESKHEDWVKEYISTGSHLGSHLKQAEFWQKCSGATSPSELYPNMILGLIVEDTRIYRPERRTKADNSESTVLDNSFLMSTSELLTCTPLWDFDLRNRICEKMMSTHEFCSQRNRHALVPGENCEFENDMQPVPLLLIQRPGSQNIKYKRLGYGSGWDIIVPSGYGLPLWLSLIMWGARPGALRETNTISRESGQDLFLPDTVSGLKESAAKHLELRYKYFRLPPNKRSSYVKLGISSPFKCCFKQLVQEWSDKKDAEFFVLREQALLRSINDAVSKKRPLPQLPEDCLIPVYLRLQGRGNIDDFSVICLPKKNDLKKNLKQFRLRKHDPVYSEPTHVDVNAKKRKEIRQNHKRLLKRLRGRRVRAKRRSLAKGDRFTKMKAGTTSIVSAHEKKMWELYLPEKPEKIRHQCTREVFGYVTQSDFSFTEGTVTCVGYVTAPGLTNLLKLIHKCKVMVLVRGTKSKHYRFAYLHVNCLS